MKNFRNNHILASFAAVSSLFISIMFVLDISSLVKSYSSEMTKTNDRISLLSRNTARNCEIFIDSSFSILRNISSAIEKSTVSRSGINSFLKRTVADNHVFDSVEIYSSEGILVNYSHHSDAYYGFDYSSSIHFAAPAQTGKPYVSDIMYSNQSGSSTIILSLPFKNGVISGFFSAKKLNDIISENQSDNFITLITDKKGTLIFHPDNSKVIQQENILNEKYIFNALNGIAGTYKSEASGTTYLISSVISGKYGWAVASLKDTSEINTYFSFHKSVIITKLIISLAVCIFLIYMIRSNIIIPLAKIRNKISSAINGEYTGIKRRNFFSEIGMLTGELNGLMSSFSEKEESMLKSKIFLDKIFQNLKEAIYFLDEDGKIQYINQSAKHMFGFTPGKMISSYDSIDFSTYDQNGNIMLPENFPAFQSLKNRKSDSALYKIVSNDMSFKWVSEHIYLFENDNGVFEGILSCSSDITDLKLSTDRMRRTLTEKDILLKEIHHRVKNNLQIVSSLLSIQLHSGRTASLESVLTESKNRVKVMALIHERLYRSEDFSRIEIKSFLTNLVQQVFTASSADSSRITYEVRSDNLYMSIDDAVPCGLIINELITNSIKHAFKTSNSGKIIIEFLVLQNGKRSLSIADDGDGLSPEIDLDKNANLGINLVNSLVKQIGGELNIVRQENGIAFIIVF